MTQQQIDGSQTRYLFRGKRLDNGEWVHGYYLADTAPCELKANGECVCKHDGSDTLIFSWRDDLHEYDDVQIDPVTVGQCTGLCDKNGTMIFEGDVCKDTLGWAFEVRWDNENARFLGHHAKARGDTYICYVGREPVAEIIGNVHDNPELLEKEARP